MPKVFPSKGEVLEQKVQDIQLKKVTLRVKPHKILKSMAVEIRKIDLANKQEVKAFIRFNYELYKDNPYSVPDLLEDMYETYDPKRNDAFTFCEADLFLAYREGVIVGIVTSF